MKRYPYFKPVKLCVDGSPAPGPLRIVVERTVRFEEVDLMGVVWHGRYPGFLEDGRVAFGTRFGIGYELLAKMRTPAPVKQMHIDYVAPLRFNQTFRIITELYWSEAARMNFAYALHDEKGGLRAQGYTVQLFTTMAGELLLEQPDFYADFCRKWKSGALRGKEHDD